MDESKTIGDGTGVEDTEVSTPITAESDGDRYEAQTSPLVPRHARQAYETYVAELDELLAHLASNPTERWVAYRGRQRLGISSDHRGLYSTCLEQFPDHQFCVYGIDACEKYPGDTVI